MIGISLFIVLVILPCLKPSDLYVGSLEKREYTDSELIKLLSIKADVNDFLSSFLYFHSSRV